MLIAIIMVGSLAALLLLAGVVLLLLGRRIPEQHVATASVRVNAAPEAVFDLVSDVPSHKEWAEGITAINPLPEVDGRKRCEMVMGHNRFTLLSSQARRPELFTMSIDDANASFRGDWTYRFTAEGRATRVELTETGYVPSPIPRAMIHYLFGYHMFLKKNLRALGRKFGDAQPVISIEKVH